MLNLLAPAAIVLASVAGMEILAAVTRVCDSQRFILGPEVTARYSTGELIRHNEVYARSSPLFDTDDERYRWINAVHTVALNQMSLSEVHYKVFEVL